MSTPINRDALRAHYPSLRESEIDDLKGELEAIDRLQHPVPPVLAPTRSNRKLLILIACGAVTALLMLVSAASWTIPLNLRS